MTTPNQLETVLQEIDAIKAEIQETKVALAAARDPADVASSRQQLEDLNKKRIFLLELQTTVLRNQASGEHCLQLSLCQHLIRLAFVRGLKTLKALLTSMLALVKTVL